LVIGLAFLSLSILGCGKEVRQSFDGIYCSHEDEDPMYVCSRAYDLVCIATDKHINATTGMLGPDRYLCRLSCKPGDSCPDGVCCPGIVHGNNRGSDHACVPISFCENPPDARPRDSGQAETPREAGAEAAGDGAGDSPQDAGAGTDADAGDAAADGPVDGPDDAVAG
jgi:hypothetical protein